MRLSQFNSIIQYDGSYALYNSFNNKVIFIEEQLKELLDAAKNEDIENLKDIHPSFYEYLLLQNFITAETPTEEINKVKELSKMVDENPNNFHLTINPTMNCNFKCWYCYETHIKDSKLSANVLKNIKLFIFNTINQQPLSYFTLSFFGGEPLLYFNKDVKPIINYFMSACIENNIEPFVSFTTNGYLINIEHVTYFLDKNINVAFQITLDGYKEEHDKVRFVHNNKGSYNEIIQNIKLLITNKLFVRLRINFTEENISNAYLIADEFDEIDNTIKENFLLIDYHRVWQTDKVDDISTLLDINKDKVRNKNIVVSGNYSPNNVVNSCYADKRNSAVINYNGDVYKCTARDFLSQNRVGFLNELGEIVWENNHLELRMQSKFKNKPCLSCRILPICNGGCSQHAFEHSDKDEYCVFHGDENEKDKVIKSKIEEILIETDV